jgi:hypothetical protein
VPKYSGTKEVADALVRAGVIENPNTIQSLTITVSAADGVTVTVVKFGDGRQVARALDELTEVGYRLVPVDDKQEEVTDDGR